MIPANFLDDFKSHQSLRTMEDLHISGRCLGKLVHVGKLPLVCVVVNTNDVELYTF